MTRKEYYIKNRERILLNFKRWREKPENKKKIASYCHNYYVRNKEKINATSKKWREEHRERSREIMRNHLKRKKDKFLEDKHYICKLCEQEFYPSRTNQKFCSRKCATKYHYMEYVKRNSRGK